MLSLVFSVFYFGIFLIVQPLRIKLDFWLVVWFGMCDVCHLCLLILMHKISQTQGKTNDMHPKKNAESSGSKDAQPEPPKDDTKPEPPKDDAEPEPPKKVADLPGMFLFYILQCSLFLIFCFYIS